MGAEFHADRRKDMTKLIVAFRNSANANKKHPNFETEYLQLRITTQRPYVTNEQNWYCDISYIFIDIRSISAQLNA